MYDKLYFGYYEDSFGMFIRNTASIVDKPFPEELIKSKNVKCEKDIGDMSSFFKVEVNTGKIDEIVSDYLYYLYLNKLRFMTQKEVEKIYSLYEDGTIDSLREKILESVSSKSFTKIGHEEMIDATIETYQKKVINAIYTTSNGIFFVLSKADSNTRSPDNIDLTVYIPLCNTDVIITNDGKIKYFVELPDKDLFEILVILSILTPNTVETTQIILGGIKDYFVTDATKNINEIMEKGIETVMKH